MMVERSPPPSASKPRLRLEPAAAVDHVSEHLQEGHKRDGHHAALGFKTNIPYGLLRVNAMRRAVKMSIPSVTLRAGR